MISAIISLFGVVRGLFVAGGFFGSIFTWLSGSFGWITGALLWIATAIKDFLVGTAAAFKKVMIYLSAYHLVEMARRLLFIFFITMVLGYAINYAFTNITVFSDNTISVLVSEFITSILSFGPIGQNLLAFMTKMGFFESLALLLTVMLYTLTARIAMTILFK